MLGVETEWLKTQLVPKPAATFEERVVVRDPQAAALPRAFLRCTLFPAYAAEEARAVYGGWRCAQRECGHFAQLERAQEVAEAVYLQVQ